ncbi:histidine kinase [Hymenobacter oligotrophus]|uniref:Histidine kinase n=1 Tax=Hymenobacter oligotrophus TaxID=2319843 RepID=A0A3B7RAA0_9BACT|nr:sensor histidine kinase [Hymenobacter oligotrophus]AYA37699.1 histidine kinase [Hymenobacter oligotrophus]
MLLQGIIWAVIVALLFAPRPGQPIPPPGPFWVLQLTVLVLLAGAYAINARWAVPRLLSRRRAALFVLLQVGLFLGLLTVRQRLASAMDMPRYLAGLRARSASAGNPGPPPGQPLRQPVLLDPGAVMVAVLVLSVSTSLGMARQARQEEDRRRVLERAQLELERVQMLTEVSLLKAQLNPHFFFNTLNNIYALTRSDVERARTAIHRLSRLMRYVLYDTQAGTTLLSQEVRFLQDYIELMQLRLTDQVQLTVEWPAPLREVALAPLLLLPYLENAFKHGVDTDAPSRIYIGLRQPTPETLAFEVRNTCPASPAANLEPGGIGLPNTERRLALLYPDRHTLTVAPPAAPGGEYRVHLTLQLT